MHFAFILMAHWWEILVQRSKAWWKLTFKNILDNEQFNVSIGIRKVYDRIHEAAAMDNIIEDANKSVGWSYMNNKFKEQFDVVNVSCNVSNMWSVTFTIRRFAKIPVPSTWNCTSNNTWNLNINQYAMEISKNHKIQYFILYLIELMWKILIIWCTIENHARN